MSISSDEESDDDWEIIDNHHVRVKAERSGKGNGRVYTINITCTDISGNQNTDSTTIKVLENMSLKSEKQKTILHEKTFSWLVPLIHRKIILTCSFKAIPRFHMN
jgi:hypothetical protein